MRKTFPAIVGAVALSVSFAAPASSSLKTAKDKASYSIGVNLGSQLAQSRDELNFDSIILGIEDAYKGKKLKLNMDEMRKSLTDFQKQHAAREQAKKAAIAENNKKAGEAFLAENKKKKGVKTTKSGLQYKVIKSGKGASPKPTDTVVTHYEGTLINGKVFDSSYKRGKPATFPVNGVIKGWTEALQLMKVGDKWKLYIPSELAYGERGAGKKIGPNSTLIFDIELLDIKDKKAKK